MYLVEAASRGPVCVHSKVELASSFSAPQHSNRVKREIVVTQLRCL